MIRQHSHAHHKPHQPVDGASSEYGRFGIISGMISGINSGINYIWRLFATGFSFAAFGLGGVTIPWIAAPLIRLTSRNPEERQHKARRLTQRVFSLFIQMLRALGILSWDIQGLDRLQRSGLLILANHPTLLDIVFLVAFTPHANCVVKGRLRSNPGTAGFIKLTGFMANDSGGEFIDNAHRSIANGGALIIFPEGTRTAADEPIRFQRGAANLALRAGLAITPVFIRCHPITLTKAHRWYNIPEHRFHMQFRVGEDIAVTGYFDQPPSRAARVLTRNLEQFFNRKLRLYEHHQDYHDKRPDPARTGTGTESADH